MTWLLEGEEQNKLLIRNSGGGRNQDSRVSLVSFLSRFPEKLFFVEEFRDP